MPAGISVFPGQSNTYVKDFRSSGKLQVSFSRNPRDFALANYVQYVPVKRDQGSAGSASTDCGRKGYWAFLARRAV